MPPFHRSCFLWTIRHYLKLKWQPDIQLRTYSENVDCGRKPSLWQRWKCPYQRKDIPDGCIRQQSSAGRSRGYLHRRQRLLFSLARWQDLLVGAGGHERFGTRRGVSIQDEFSWSALSKRVQRRSFGGLSSSLHRLSQHFKTNQSPSKVTTNRVEGRDLARSQSWSWMVATHNSWRQSKREEVLKCGSAPRLFCGDSFWLPVWIWNPLSTNAIIAFDYYFLTKCII